MVLFILLYFTYYHHNSNAIRAFHVLSYILTHCIIYTYTLHYPTYFTLLILFSSYTILLLNHIYTEKFIQIFQNPVEYMSYLQSSKFSSDLITLCITLETLLEEELRCLLLQSPVYVFGDIHGNLEDLHFFSDNIWKLGRLVYDMICVYIGV